MNTYVFFTQIYLSAVLLQLPTDYPPVRTREVPENLQNPVIIWMIVAGILLVLVLGAYFLRIDKKMTKWFRR